MKKIPTLFKRTFENHRISGISDKVTPGMEWVLDGEGVATVKIDGSCTAVINGRFYKRYDAKRGKTPPPGAIPCCDPDPVTGHWPHWVEVDPNSKADRWLWQAFQNADTAHFGDGTYEAIGLHFQGNPYKLKADTLEKHGAVTIDANSGLVRSFEGIREYLRANPIEGIVFWRDGEPQCKIKRRDFGFSWPCEGCENIWPVWTETPVKGE